MLASSKGQFSSQIVNMKEASFSLPNRALTAPEFAWWTWLTLSLTRNSCSWLSPRSPKWSAGLTNETLISGPATIGFKMIGCGSGLGWAEHSREGRASSDVVHTPASYDRTNINVRTANTGWIMLNSRNLPRWLWNRAVRVLPTRTDRWDFVFDRRITGGVKERGILH